MTGQKSNKILDPILTGVDYMLPVVVAGGIMLGLSFLVDDASINPETFGTNTSVAAFFNTNGNLLFSFMLPVFAAAIGYKIAGTAAIPAGLLGGALSNAGRSSFFGALILGFAVGYLVNFLKKVLRRVPDSIQALVTILIIPLVSALLIGLASVFIVEPLLGQVNESLTQMLAGMSGSSQIILGMVLAGMQMVDMGGPINKVAYLFATAQLAEGNYTMMSAVLAGALIGPYVTGIASLLFKQNYSREEQSQGISNLIMGLAGISEGGIPFLVKNPLQVGVACIGGAMLAGALSVALGCSVMAPFGGFFILPLNANPFGFVIAVVSGVILGLILLVLIGKLKLSKSK